MKKEELLELRNIIEDVSKNGINENYIKSLYSILGNEGINLTFSNSSLNTAKFVPKFKYITINLDKTIKWVDEMLKDSKDYFDIKDEELLKSYLLISLLTHEVEHSTQKLISEGRIEPKYEYQVQAYKDIYGVMTKKEYLLPRPISLLKDIIRFGIYQKHAYSFILERNASVEGFNTASQIADLSSDQEALDYLITQRNSYMMLGYLESEEGTLKYTYDTLGMQKQYEKLVLPTDISISEKTREGLSLTKGERDKAILSLKQGCRFSK